MFEASDLFEFANALSDLEGLTRCYHNNNIASAYASSIYDCPGYRLPTDAEWEYAARSGTTKDFWTGEGADLGGDLNYTHSCAEDMQIFDGVNNPSINDYVWFCGSTSDLELAAQLEPNGFGLYDVQGSLSEWVSDYTDCGLSPPSSLNPPFSWKGEPRHLRSISNGLQ